MGRKADDLAIFKNFEDLLIHATNKANEGITISAMDEVDQPLIFVNDGFERLTGYCREEVIGKNCRFLQGEEKEQPAIDVLRQAIKNGEKTTVELQNFKKDGTSFWNRLSITPLKDEKGITTHYVGVQSDITELRETQERLKSANKELSLFQQKMNFELLQAREVQDFILPSVFPKSEKVQFSSVFEPVDQIGGDFYDIAEINQGVFGLLIADVTGHGIQAALLTFMTFAAFKNIASQTLSTAEVVRTTNGKLCDKMPSGSFVTMFYAIYDSSNRRLTFTQAGHPEGYVLRPSTKEVISLSSVGSLVGAFSNEKMAFEESHLQLEVGDKLLLYTDAILEVRDQKGRMMPQEQFFSFLVDHCDLAVDELLLRIKAFGLDYNGSMNFRDDFTLIGMEVSA